MNPYRLSRVVLPRRYDLVIEPDLERGTFVGSARIEVEVQESLREVWLNAVDLQVSSAFFISEGQSWAADIALHPSSERCCLTFDQPLPRSIGELRLEFAGLLSDQLRGFYRSRCRDAAGRQQWLAATQFEATDARRAFPCWDEPDFKAVFSLTLIVPTPLVALSNTAVVDEQILNGKKQVRFAETIPLSSYLVAFVIGPLEATEVVRVGTTPLRVWCLPGKNHLARFALEAAAFSLRFFEDYYGRSYPGDKLDLIALPEFAAGAMENFGAITFRESALLVDVATATHQEKQRVADVVMHENAHLWFGDLVTMRWWNGLWLNEAFATFLELLAVDAWRPYWQRWTTFAVSRSEALIVDGLLASRPVEFPVQAPEDAEAMFDVLTYEKGASILRMLEQYIGPEVFRAGVRLYLERHALDNADTEDLWRALADASGLPIPQWLNDWVFRAGYPLLTARREGEELVLTQQRFSYLPCLGESAPVWHIPVHIRCDTLSDRQTIRVLLREPECRVPLPAEWQLLLVNNGGHGFYRVRYDSELLGMLLDRLTILSPIDRYHLLNDSWAAVQAGFLSLSSFLDLTERFVNERDRHVWSVMLQAFGQLSLLVEDEDRPGLQKLICQRISPTLEELTWYPSPQEDDLTRQLRGDLLRAMGVLGDDSAIQAEALLVYGGGRADASVLSATIAILAHTGEKLRYEEFLNRFLSASTPQIEQRYLLALAGFRSEELIERTLALSLDGTVRTQDAPLLLRSMLLGRHSRHRAWQFVQANWDTIAHRFTGPGLRRLCEGFLGLTTMQWEEEVQNFLRDRRIHLGGKVLAQLLEQLRIAVQLKHREGEALRSYLDNLPSS